MAGENKTEEKTVTNVDEYRKPGDGQKRKNGKRISLSEFFILTVGCFEILGALVAVIGLFIALRDPQIVIQLLESRLEETASPVVIQLSTNTPYPTYIPLPTHTPYPTYTPLPTYVPLPTYTPLPTHTPYLTPTPTPEPVREVSLPFEDNFDAGLRPEWFTWSGDWRIANGRLTTLTRRRLSCVAVGDPTWKDYAIETYFRGGVTNAYLGIIMRAQDVNNLVMFKLGLHGSSLRVKQAGQERELLGGAGTYWHTPSNTSGYLRLEVRGDFYEVYYDDKFWLSINDDTFSSGLVGLCAYCDNNCAAFDNFKVVELSG